MPITKVYSTGSSGTADDGLIWTSSSSWAGARDVATGTVIDTIYSNASATLGANEYAYVRGSSVAGRRGSLLYKVIRSFYHFDVESITTCTSVSLKLMGYQGGGYSTGDLIVLESDAFGHGDEDALAAGDFDGIIGWSGTGAMTAATEYSSPVANSSWVDSSTYNSITLNSDAILDINARDHFIIALVEYTHDYLDAVPQSGFSAVESSLGGYHSEYTGVSRDPYIDITYTSTGYGHKVNTVAAANIGKVDTVATANIGKINTVD